VTGRRSLAQAIAACAFGGLLVLVASGRVWSRATVTSLGHPVRLVATGHSVAPALPALGIALIALAGGVLAARGVLRRIVGVVVVFVGAVTIGVAVTAPGDVSTALEHKEVGAQGIAVHGSANGWWVLALAGAVVATLAGAATVARGERWAALGARYENPGAPAPVADPAAEAWAALDRGEDPTG
jgi:uncharacterized membrane protein (TIGR02234 family)